jgi:hypothetical protein
MKICSKCKIEKDLYEFPKHRGSKDGFYCQCKSCKNESKRNNKNKLNKVEKIFRIKNITDKEIKEKSNTRLSGYYPQCKECRAQYRKQNQHKIKEYNNLEHNKEKKLLSIKNSIQKRKNNYPFIKSLSNKLSKLNKRFKTSFKIIDLLGCSLDDFKTYIESNFQDWINWDTYASNKDKNDYWYLNFINNNLNSPHELLHYTNIKIVTVIRKKPTSKIFPKEGFKICCQCKKEKPITEFFKNHKNKDGLFCKCKLCKPNPHPSNYIKRNNPRQPLDKKLKRISVNLNKSIRRSFKNKGIIKSKSISQTLGCSYQDFKLYIESQFEPWMNWDNYGLFNGQLNYGWDLDHIIPKSSAKTEEDILKLNHYTNFKPLCSYTNRYIKKDRLDF